MMKINKNAKIVKLSNSNSNNNTIIPKMPISTQNSIKKLIPNPQRVKVGEKKTKMKTIQNAPLSQLRIITNNNYNPNIALNNNLSRSVYNPIINNQIIPWENLKSRSGRTENSSSTSRPVTVKSSSPARATQQRQPA